MPYQIKGDIHTHTMFSRHAYSTIGENVAAAKAAGLEILGSADHFSSMLFCEQDIKNFQFFCNVEIWPRVWDGVTVLRGAEVDILSLDGKLFGQDIVCTQNIAGRPFKRERTLFEWVTGALDYLVASVHNDVFAEGASLAQGTEMYIRALEDPKVFVLGHTGRSGVDYDLDEVLTVAKEKHKLIEINEHTLESARGHRNKMCTAIAERCAELGVGIAVNTDAHIHTNIGKFPYAMSFLEEIHFPQELIMNRNRDVLLGELAASGVCDLTACG